MLLKADFKSPVHRKAIESSKGARLKHEHSADDMLLSKRKGRLKSSTRSRPAGAYSRQDIREQYCINSKELAALEQLGRNRLFGCLSAGNLLSLTGSGESTAHSNRTNDPQNSGSDTSGSSSGCKHSLSLLSCLKK